MTGPEEFRGYLLSAEGPNLEFKSAARRFDFEELVQYCVALANAGGGKILLGVTDTRPREVVGTQAFAEPGRTSAGLFEQLAHPIPIEEYFHEGRRVLLVHVPPRLPGIAWQHKGRFWTRAGDALVPMSDEQLRRIHQETASDFSAETCPAATLADLDPAAIELFRSFWQRKAPQADLAGLSVDRLLADAELLVDGRLTYAALILLGTRAALGRYLGQAEVVFEYRSSEEPGPAAVRQEFRQGFLLTLDPVWQLVQLRNDLQHFQQGLFVLDVPTFNERVVREAVLNAVSHRDYRNGGSVFVRQFARRIEISSPGGFPPGVTPENVLWQQSPRNRRIAEALARCGLVERAGQGFDLIYRECIRQSKRLPDFSHTDDYSVWVTLHGEIRDPEFLRFLEEIGRERLATFTTDDFLVVDLVHSDRPIPTMLRPRVERLVEGGVLERIGRGKQATLLLSHRFYRHLGRSGAYTRRRGLARETYRQLLLQHIRICGAGGTALADLQEVLPGLSRRTIQGLAESLRNDGLVRLEGKTRSAKWYPLPEEEPSP